MESNNENVSRGRKGVPLVYVILLLAIIVGLVVYIVMQEIKPEPTTQDTVTTNQVSELPTEN